MPHFDTKATEGQGADDIARTDDRSSGILGYAPAGWALQNSVALESALPEKGEELQAKSDFSQCGRIQRRPANLCLP